MVGIAVGGREMNDLWFLLSDFQFHVISRLK